MIGEIADGILQQQAADGDRRHEQRRVSLAVAEPHAIDGQQPRHAGIDGAEDERREKCCGCYAQQAEHGLIQVRLDPRRRAACQKDGDEGQEHHRGACNERRDPARADQAQHRGAYAEAARQADRIKRHHASAIALVGELVDPEFGDDEEAVERGAQDKADGKPEPEIGRFVDRHERGRDDDQHGGEILRRAVFLDPARHMRRHKNGGEAACREIEAVDGARIAAAFEDEAEQAAA